MSERRYMVEVDGFGSGGEQELADDLTALGLPAQPVQWQRRLDAAGDAEGFFTLILTEDTWKNVLLGVQVVGGSIAAIGGALVIRKERLEVIRVRLARSSMCKGVALVKFKVPSVPGRWGMYSSFSLAPDVCVDAVGMWLERANGVDRALRALHEEGHAAFNDSAECLVFSDGFRVRWVSPKRYAKHERDYTVEGTAKGPVRDGWTNTPRFEE